MPDHARETTDVARCESCGFAAAHGHRIGCSNDDYEPPYMGDEPLGTCVIHGDYWTDDCLRCGRESSQEAGAFASP